MKMAMIIIEKSVTSLYHGGKISESQQLKELKQ